ncbi:MAG: MlaD family protein [Candidatus Zixiibacteriota bacterium]
MRRSARVPWSEVRVGAVILFAFAVLLWAAFNGSGMTFFQKTNELKVYYQDVGGLATGAPVWVGGIEVGHVSSIKFVEREGIGQIEVVFGITKEAWPLVSSESKVSVATMGLMGDKYLSVTPREKGQPPAEPGMILEPAGGSDMTAAFAEAPDMMNAFSETLGRLNTILQRIERGEGYLGRITTDSPSSDELDSLAASTTDLLTELRRSQARLVSSIETASHAFDSLTTGILHGEGTLSKLVWDTTLYTEMSSVSARMDNMLARWESGRGTAHQMMTDSTLYFEARDLVTDTRALIDDIMANPRKYFKFSVF